MAKKKNGSAPKEPQVPQMKVLGQFVRDLSFENIVTRKPVNAEVRPDFQAQVTIDFRKIAGDSRFEVVSKYSITSKNKNSDDVLFLLELEYVGLFQIKNIAGEQLHPFLMIECPRMMFPFVRRIVSDVTRDGGFPPLNLDVIDFVTLYRERLKQQQKEPKGEKSPAN
ncbi:MAG: protein-export chaperone SecB [Boseongicola sp. SB0676_bin_33]|uniref:Protein-export protein SecB n=1 Tax=Boseongicola sp. SB0664_bin_43 TaxID=2604844 RepID=A0A6B0Y121_9RHOB|nr:protein-export chaperone SecB [Boseongicola sp. SB0664_bin_43]MYF89998.1 protein-export chaperone SecB [Boseongicola sp. SB0676_bin_33]MYK33099.1 protein-export chaperone SecB [Boseongicola sp. SB0670_bin_30]